MTTWSTRGLIFSALFAAILMALSYVKVSLPFSPVPITFQTLAVMLAGSLLGARYGALSVLLVIGMIAAGFPVLGGRGGVALLTGPTAGYILSWPVAAFLIGYFAQRVRLDQYAIIKLFAINFLFGALFVYPFGVSWLAYSAEITSLPKALTAGMWPFLPGDLLKAFICAAAVVGVSRVYPMGRIIGNNQ